MLDNILKKIVGVVDSIMGSGKTTNCVKMMKLNPERSYIYITPLLSECQRICNACPELNFKMPPEKTGSGGKNKSTAFKDLIMLGDNIAITHALFAKMKITEKDIYYLKLWNYCVILDETTSVIKPINNLNKKDEDILLGDKFIEVDDMGMCTWIGGEPPERYKDLHRISKTGNLMLCEGVFYWVFPMTIIKNAPQMFILTFMFEASHMYYYLKAHGIELEFYHVEDGQLVPGRQDLTEHKKRLRELIDIYQGRSNAVGEDYFTLSYRFWTAKNNNEKRKMVLSKAYSFFKNQKDVKPEECLYAAYKKDEKNPVVPHYGNHFLSYNYRASNEYSNCTTLAYLVNVFENPDIAKWFTKISGLALNEEAYALSTLLQWIWRSAIRNGQPIRLFLPSKRMRDILENWLNN